MVSARRPSLIARTALALAGAGLLASTALVAGTGAAQAQDHGRAPTHATARHLRPVLRYVALGDSYTAAPFVPVTDPAAGCLRSNHNYPTLVAAAIHPSAFVDVSCSGAQSKDMSGPQTTAFGTTVAPQLDSLTRGTDLVTLSIGGNDESVFGTLTGYCTTLRSQDPTGHPCQTHFAVRHGRNQLIAASMRTEGRVAGVIRAIRQRAPHARIVVIDYPQLIPDHGTCPSLLPLADGDYRFGLRIGRTLNASLRQAARRTHVTFVDLARPSRGHSICSAHPWINGQTTDPTRALAYHPFAVEQAAAASLVVRALRHR